MTLVMWFQDEQGWRGTLFSRRKPVCSALVIEDKNDCWLDGLETDVHHRNQGYAGQLLANAQLEFADRFQRMRLVVRPYSHQKGLDQAQLIRFYVKRGFNECQGGLFPIMECQLNKFTL